MFIIIWSVRRIVGINEDQNDSCHMFYSLQCSYSCVCNVINKFVRGLAEVSLFLERAKQMRVFVK